MITKVLLTFLFAVSLTSTGLAHDSDLTGILEKPEEDGGPYILELDGGSGSFYLRGEVLSEFPEGVRIWVSGEIQTEVYDEDTAKDSPLLSKRWRVFLQVERCRSISDPFALLEPINITVNGEFENLLEVLRAIAKQTGWSVVAGPEVSDENTAMSLHYENMKAEKVLSEVLGKHDFTFQMVGQTIIITDKDRMKDLMEIMPPARSLEDLIKAAEQGDPLSQWLLGVSFYTGSKGLKEDHEQAVKWYTKAAEQGYAQAQCDLAYMYNKGYGVPQDTKQAIRWYTKSADQGNKSAQRRLKLLSKRMNKKSEPPN